MRARAVRLFNTRGAERTSDKRVETVNDNDISVNNANDRNAICD